MPLVTPLTADHDETTKELALVYGHEKQYNN